MRVAVAALIVLASLSGCVQSDGDAATRDEDPAPNVPLEPIAENPPTLDMHWDPRPPLEKERVTFTLLSDPPGAKVVDAAWDFGDGTGFRGIEVQHEYRQSGSYEVTVQAQGADGWVQKAVRMVEVYTSDGKVAEPPEEDAAGDEAEEGNSDPVPPANETRPAPATFVPHVVVGVPDSGFNVYHEVYRRPDLTVHPCTYIEDYPCDVPALELTLDAPTWQAAFNADQAIWASIRPGDRYWIPGTNIIGAVCDTPYEGSTAASTNPTGGIDHCILDDTSMHGTGTSSSVLSENPDALLVVVEGNSGGQTYLLDGFFPIDVVSYSWGAAVPLAGLGLFDIPYAPFYVAASGNEGAFPVVLEGTKVHPDIITVGAADAGSPSEPGYSGWKTMDFVSEYCRPTADTRTFDGVREQYCGTSFSAPTFAGALSRVIWELRQQSGYTGSILADGTVDPLLGVTKWDLRAALNRSATYTPEDAFQDGSHAVPLVLPWYQWGWGYIARNEVPAIVSCIIDQECGQRPAETEAYMEALWTLRLLQSGNLP